MDTLVTVEVLVPDAVPATDRPAALERALGWFREVAARCSRFDPNSELRDLCRHPGMPVAVSTVLFEAVRFAVEVAEASGGAFDPTIGHRLEALGFDRNHRTGVRSRSGIDPGTPPSWRDVRLDADHGTITLARPLLLDLGAVAKGLAIDLALQELSAFAGCAVEAGGDLAVRGSRADGGPWRIGIRHPRQPDAVCTVLHVRDRAVCTSGDYERPAPDRPGESHLVDPASGLSTRAAISCTVIAPNAMAADALSTAAIVLGPERAVPWLQEQGADGLLVDPGLARHATAGFGRWEQCL